MMDRNNNYFIRIRENFLFRIIIFGIFVQLLFCPSLANSTINPDTVEISICAETDYQTKAYIYSSEQKYPVIMVMAGVHGNELAGIEAARQFMDNIKLERGTVIILPEANKKAIMHGIRAMSDREDLNRNYPGDINSNDTIKRLAGEIFEIMNKNEVEFLLDLHESADYYNKNNSSYGQTIVLDDNKNPFLNKIAKYLVDELNSSIVSPENKFEVIVKPIDGSSTYEALNHLKICGITFETCKKIDYKKRLDFHYQCIEKILAYFDLVSLQMEGVVENN
jgi:succinylglutamate desuccinylase